MSLIYQRAPFFENYQAMQDKTYRTAAASLLAKVVLYVLSYVAISHSD